jgi:hypothetical protein
MPVWYPEQATRLASFSSLAMNRQQGVVCRLNKRCSLSYVATLLLCISFVLIATHAWLTVSSTTTSAQDTSTPATPRDAATPAQTEVVNTAPRRLRLFVCVAAYYTPDKNMNFVTRVLSEFVSSNFTAQYDVFIHVDTNSDELANALGDMASSVHEFRVWTLEEVGGNYINLPRQHRALAAAKAEGGLFDYLVYTEDDVLVPFSAVSFFIKHEAPLSSLGWSLGFVRVELWSHDGKTPVVIDNEPRRNARVYFHANTSGNDGAVQLFAQPRSCFAGSYALSAASVRALVSKENSLWTAGFSEYPERERFGIGSAFVRAGEDVVFEGYLFNAKGWRMRGLVGLTAAGVAHPDGVVVHLPSKYATKPMLDSGQIWTTTLGKLFLWPAGGMRAAEPLPPFPPPYPPKDI